MADVQQMLSSIPAWGLVSSKKALMRLLEKSLEKGEMVVDLLDGFIEAREHSNMVDRGGVLFVTSKRILFIGNGPEKGSALSLNYNDIEHIAQEKGFAALKFIFQTKSGEISFKTFAGASSAGKFIAHIREIMGDEITLSKKESAQSFDDIAKSFIEKTVQQQFNEISKTKSGDETDGLIGDLANLNFLFAEAKKIRDAIISTELFKNNPSFKKNVINDLLAISSLAAMADGTMASEELLFISLVMLPLNPEASPAIETLAKSVFAFDSFPLHYRKDIENFWDEISTYIKREKVSIPGTMLPSMLDAQGYDASTGTTCFDRIAQAYYSFAQCLMKSDGKILASEEERLREIRALIYQKAGDAAEGQKVSGKEETLEEVMEKINSLVGMKNIKGEISTFINLIKVQKARTEKNLPLTPLSLHCVFYGPPGTGKTTIARYLGKVYRALGLLKKGQLVETDRAGLVAGYVGQTAIKVDEVVQKALDGVLFIDEAYSLVPSNAAGNDFGQEAIDAILKRMEDYRDRLVVIVAGYTDEMNRFINSNPGLKSRFSRYFYFEHYTPDELMAIFEIFCKNAAFKIDDGAREKMHKNLTTLYEKRDRSFGNGRLVRNIFEKIVERQANRIAGITPLTEEVLCAIVEADVPDIDDIIT